MPATITTRDGDMIDAIVWRATGRIAGALEATLDANPHIAKRDVVLPAGIGITIPDAATAQPAPAYFKLWE